jgi:hypothetical protein
VIPLSVFLFIGLQQQGDASRHAAKTDQRGTENAPLVVKINPTPETEEETAQDKKDREEKSANDRNLVFFTKVLALVGALQLLVFGYQAYKLRATVRAAGEQSKAMERHIGEAARSAHAMEKIVATIDAGNKAVMRAYLTVVIGQALYQERRPAQSDVRFEAKPNLVNTGNTPARKVRIRTKADILPIPIPGDFGFPLPEEDPQARDGSVAAHHTYILSGIIEDFVPDAEVASIKEGVGKCLCVWGLVTYEDTFGDSHTTKFGQQITWLPNGQIFGYYIPGQNDTT